MSLTKRLAAAGVQLVDSRDLVASEVLELERTLEACEKELAETGRFSLQRRAEGLRQMLAEKRAELRKLNGEIQEAVAEAISADAADQPLEPGDLVRQPGCAAVVEVLDVLEDRLRCRIPPEFRQPEDSRAAFEVTGRVVIVQRWGDRHQLTRPHPPPMGGGRPRSRKAQKKAPSSAEASPDGQLALF